jgi:tetratricopeptide (TPR) repeat protein
MSRRSQNLIVHVIVILIGIAAIAFLSGYAEARKVTIAESYTDNDLEFQGKRLKGFGLGFEGLLADWYWMRSLQYIGDKVLKNPEVEIDLEDLRPLNPRLLYPFLDNATDLDPKLMAAYSYGAAVLPAIDPLLAIRLTEKGIANNPDAWRLYQYLGYIYWRTKEYEKAAEIYERGSQIDGAASFMRMMAAAMRTRGGSRAVARQIYSQLLSEAEDQQSRANAELRLLELDSLDEREAIQSALVAFRDRTGRCPQGLAEIYPLLRNVELPNGRKFRVDAASNLVDPTGVQYELDQQRCVVLLGNGSRIPKPLS